MSYSGNEQRPSVFIRAIDRQCMQKNMRMFKEYYKFMQVDDQKSLRIGEQFLQNDLCDAGYREEELFSLWKKLAKTTGLLFLVDQDHPVKDTIFIHMVDQQKKVHQFYIDGKQFLQALDGLNEQDCKQWQEALRDMIQIRVIIEKNI